MRHRIPGGTGLSVPPGSAPAEMGFPPVEAIVMFIGCPAYLNKTPVRSGTGSLAEVEGRCTMRSPDRPLQSARIQCPARARSRPRATEAQEPRIAAAVYALASSKA
jgi:hypothetical protein